jgi:hypothetical protein
MMRLLGASYADITSRRATLAGIDPRLAGEERTQTAGLPFCTAFQAARRARHTDVPSAKKKALVVAASKAFVSSPLDLEQTQVGAEFVS